MVRLLFKIIALTLPILVLIGLTEYSARRIATGYASKRQIIEAKIENAEMIILGSSHTYFGVKAKLFDVPALNMANASQDLYYDSLLLQRYLPRASRLKTVILPLSYISLNTKLEKDWRASMYYRTWGIRPESNRFSLSDYSALSLFGMNVSRSFFLTGERPRIDAAEMDDSGSGIDDRPRVPESIANASKTVAQHESVWRDAAANIGYLNEMISALKERGVRIVIITTPVSRSYSENVDRQKFGEFESAVASICRANNLEYYNHFRDERFGPDDFTDSDHLNTRGAEKFTLLLNQELVR